MSGAEPEGGGAGFDRELAEGLRLGASPTPEELARERAHLKDLDARPFAGRLRGYLALGGPGYLQSAMTLGGGTAASSLFAGAVFGYELLWVAPVAMAIGVVMLMAVSYQTLSTGRRPYPMMRDGAGRGIAAVWALGALFASIVWHFPQYALASASVADLVDLARGTPGATAAWPFAWPLLALAIFSALLYSKSRRMLRFYETALRFTVWGIVLAFASVVLMNFGMIDWGALGRGFFGFRIPGDHVASDGSVIHGWEVAISSLSAAVGVNMVFVYPYTLLARGWGRGHRRLARYDLIFGMLIPYSLATSMMILAMATTLHVEEGMAIGKSLSPLQAAKAIDAVAGETMGRVMLDLGFIGMAMSSITLHMVCAGFACCELFGWKFGGKRHMIATLLPAPGVLGPMLWSGMALWIAVPANIICLLFLPAAYLGYTIMQSKRSVLGEDTPRGPLARLWHFAMIAITCALLAFCLWYVVDRVPAWWSQLG